MGALHEGHLTLVRRAAAENQRVVVSIFVNPLQFGEASDLEKYPRDFAGDCDLLQAAGAHMAFTGTLEQFFPGRLVQGDLPSEQRVDPGPAADGLEGAFRPGHFEGVATIVKRLFEIVQPERSYFGAKDYQQTLVVRDLARRMGFPDVVVCPISREESGLARSSRNMLLTDADRAQALYLSRALFGARERWRAGERSAPALERHLRAVLAHSTLDVEYAVVRDPAEWAAVPTDQPLERAVALLAARAGAVRLIDNLELHGDRLREGGGVRILARSDGRLVAHFESRYRLQRLEQDEPDLVLDPISIAV